MMVDKTLYWFTLKSQVSMMYAQKTKRVPPRSAHIPGCTWSKMDRLILLEYLNAFCAQQTELTCWQFSVFMTCASLIKCL